MTYNGAGLPPAGWYPDPENPTGPRRWWNGADWTDQRESPLPPPPPMSMMQPGAAPGVPPTPMGSTTASGFVSLSSLLKFALNALKNNWIPLIIVGIIGAVPAAMYYASLIRAMDGLVFDADGGINGFSDSNLVPIGIWAAVTTAVWAMLSLVASALMLNYYDDTAGQGGQMAGLKSLGGAIGRVFKRLLPAIGWLLLGYVVLTVAITVVFILMILLASIHVALAVLFVLALIPVGVFLAIRFWFTGVAVVDRPGNPYRLSGLVSKNRWWATVGYLIVILAVLMVPQAIIGQIPSLYIKVDVVQNTVAETLTISTSISTVGVIVYGFVTMVTTMLQFGIITSAMVNMYRSINRRDPASTL